MRIDLSVIHSLVEGGYLSAHKHPTADLWIYNYTPKTQFEGHWTAETLMCRGLIVRGDGTVIARPFGKFFSVEKTIELFGPLPNEPFEVTEKIDGSLGIGFVLDGANQIATRGSFDSEQALHAQRILEYRYAEVRFDAGHTYLFEIVYPGNQVVVDYQGLDDLILLAEIDTATGQELPVDRLAAYPFPLVRRFDGIQDFGQLTQLMAEREDENEEGLVVRFASGLRVKCKLASYTRLHRLLTGLTAKTVWEALSRGEDLDTLLDRVPDEFYRWVMEERSRLLLRYQTIEAACRAMCQRVVNIPDRKARAALIMTAGEHNHYVVFRMLDEKPYEEAIWRQIKPSGGTPTFRQDEPA